VAAEEVLLLTNSTRLDVLNGQVVKKVDEFRSFGFCLHTLSMDVFSGN
jgi:hypothetical protein